MRAQTVGIALWAGLAVAAAAGPQSAPAHSGIVVPLADRPFERLIDLESAVAFDFAAAGEPQAHGWLTADAAWLVWDPDWRGQVRSGADLIGQRAWNASWGDGFAALRALDDNNDGELTGGELSSLALWRDDNGNGVSEPGEVLPANVHGIAALSVEEIVTRPALNTASAGVRFDDGRTRPLYDWKLGARRQSTEVTSVRPS